MKRSYLGRNKRRRTYSVKLLVTVPTNNTHPRAFTYSHIYALVTYLHTAYTFTHCLHIHTLLSYSHTAYTFTHCSHIHTLFTHIPTGHSFTHCSHILSLLLIGCDRSCYAAEPSVRWSFRRHSSPVGSGRSSHQAHVLAGRDKKKQTSIFMINLPNCFPVQ